jgi:hypothetical protein
MGSAFRVRPGWPKVLIGRIATLFLVSILGERDDEFKFSIKRERGQVRH